MSFAGSNLLFCRNFCDRLGNYSFYLLVMLGISIYYGLCTKTMIDYSVANKGYSTPILVASIVGTIMGAYSTLGAVGQVMTLGLSGLIQYFSRVFGLLLTAQFIAPGLAKFKDAISPGDVVAHFYGKHARILAGVAASANCIAWLSIQILGIDFLLQYFLARISHQRQKILNLVQ